MNERYALRVVMPLYNAAATIGRLVDDLVKVPIEGAHEIIFVNDGSRDSIFLQSLLSQ